MKLSWTQLFTKYVQLLIFYELHHLNLLKVWIQLVGAEDEI